MARPAIAPATPEKEFSSEIVIGMSAPPTRIAKMMPKRPDSIEQRIISIVFATVTARTAGMLRSTTVSKEATRAKAVQSAWRLNSIGF